MVGSLVAWLDFPMAEQKAATKVAYSAASMVVLWAQKMAARWALLWAESWAVRSAGQLVERLECSMAGPRVDEMVVRMVSNWVVATVGS